MKRATDNITLNQLINFVTFAKCGSVKATAEKLGVSDNHVRHALHYLNRKFDNRLVAMYKGDGKPATLTVDGKIALGQFNIMLESVENLKTYLNATTGRAYQRELF